MSKEEFHEKVKRAFMAGRYLVRFHAHLRMRGRGLSEDEVMETITKGEIIEYYPDAKPTRRVSSSEGLMTSPCTSSAPSRLRK